jgi:ABC-2 type transport system permease protein
VNATILRLSTQALVGRRRGVLLLMIPAVLVVLAVVVRVVAGEGAGYHAVIALGFTLALPIVALLAASAVLGPEIDDGSIVYLLAKPVGRHVVAVSKFAAAWVATVALGALPLLVCGLVMDAGDPGRALAWTAGAGLAGTAYTALFLGLAALTRHAVVIGLIFVLLWEGLLGQLLGGIKWVAIGPWGEAVAAALSSRVEPGPGTGAGYALVAAAVVTVGSLWFAGDRLRSFTLRGDE